jgi:hypothetical protein
MRWQWSSTAADGMLSPRAKMDRLSASQELEPASRALNTSGPMGRWMLRFLAGFNN